MLQNRDLQTTPWLRGRFDGIRGAPRLLFRRMFEDWNVELAACRSGGPVVCIASGGCTAIALANSGCDVTAVDINPLQVAHVRARIDRDETVPMVRCRLLAVRNLLPRVLGVSCNVLEAFLNCDSPSRQIEMWDQIWSRRSAMALRLALHPAALRMVYDARFLRLLPKRFDRVLVDRMRRGIAVHANRDSPFMRQIVTGTRPLHLDPAIEPGAAIKLVQADLLDFLGRCRPMAFDTICLSNILDGCDDSYIMRAIAAVRRVAAPGALVVWRSFADCQDATGNWRDVDRSHLWGSVMVERVSNVSVVGGRFGIPVAPGQMGAAHVSAA